MNRTNTKKTKRDLERMSKAFNELVKILLTFRLDELKEVYEKSDRMSKVEEDAILQVTQIKMYR